MTQDEVQARLDGLDGAQARAVCCALIGHSRVQNVCFGYWTCARCDAQVGDSLAGAYNATNAVAVDHHCDTCRENVATLTWVDTWLLPVDVNAYLVTLADEAKSKATQAENQRQHDEAMAALKERQATR